MRNLLFCIVMMVAGLPVRGQQLWLEPSNFFYEPGEKLAVSIKEGMRFEGAPWQAKDSLGESRIGKSQIYFGNHTIDFSDALSDPRAQRGWQVQGGGTFLITFESNKEARELTSEEFRNYLNENGLYAIRAEMDSNQVGGYVSEAVTSYAKLLVQVGNQHDEIFSRILGTPIEIVPLSNPQTFKVGDMVGFQILANKKPVFGARVKVLNRNANTVTEQNIFSQQDGVIETRISSGGAWMISVLSLIPSTNIATDWESHRASLVFGIQ